MEDVGKRESVVGRNREWETRENVWREGAGSGKSGRKKELKD